MIKCRHYIVLDILDILIFRCVSKHDILLFGNDRNTLACIANVPYLTMVFVKISMTQTSSMFVSVYNVMSACMNNHLQLRYLDIMTTKFQDNLQQLEIQGQKQDVKFESLE